MTWPGGTSRTAPTLDRDHEMDPAGAETQLEGRRVQEDRITRANLAAQIRIRDGGSGCPLDVDLELLRSGACSRYGADDASSDVGSRGAPVSIITAPI